MASFSVFGSGPLLASFSNPTIVSYHPDRTGAGLSALVPASRHAVAPLRSRPDSGRDARWRRLQAGGAAGTAPAGGPRDRGRPEGRPDLHRVGGNDRGLRERSGHAPGAGVPTEAGLQGRRAGGGGPTPLRDR